MVFVPHREHTYETPRLVTEISLLLLYQLTNCLNAWENASCAAIDEIPGILRNPKVLYLVHNSPSAVPIPSQFNPHTIILLHLILMFRVHVEYGAQLKPLNR
jgi:hypothetical protein